MAVRTIRTDIKLDGETNFKKAMTGINGAMRNLKSEMALVEAQFKGQENSVEALTAKDRVLRQEQAQLEEKVRALNIILEKAKEIFTEDSTVADKYTQQLNRAKAELIELNRAMEANSTAMAEAGAQMEDTADEIEHLDKAAENGVNTLASALKAAGLAMTLKQIASAIKECTDASISFESAMAGVQKVTKMSDNELDGLGESIKQLSTQIPATADEIAGVAEAAARLGVSRENLLSFTEVMVALGESSDLSADQAATALARFANIAGTSAEDYERLGSVIVALGNNFATSESEIIEMASKLASAGRLAGLSEAQIMALSAAMSSVGITAEAGGTAMTQTLTKIEKAVTSGGEKLETFAEISGMSAAQFAAAWEENPITAIQAFIAGLGELDDKGESATQILDELGLSGIRQSNMLKSLALASETLAGTVDTANRAWQENTELAATAAARYDTTEAKMAMMQNAATNLKIAIGDQLTPALNTLASAGTAAFSWAAEWVETHHGMVPLLSGVTVGLTALTAAVTVHNVVVPLAKTAMVAFNVALSANPAIFIASAIIGLTVAIGSFIAQAKAGSDAVEDLAESYEDERSAAEEAAVQADALAAQMRENVSSMENAARAASKSAESLDSLAVSSEDLAKASEALTGTVDTLSKAMDEQNKNGSLSLDTALKLIDAGYAAALSIDTETGMVMLNADAYIRMTTAKLEDQIASLETQRTSLENARRLEQEAIAAEHAGSAYWEAAASKLASSAADRDNLASLNAQIAALKNVKASLGSYTSAVSASAKAGSSVSAAAKASSAASKAAKTQAEEDLAAYKELKAALDHERAVSLADERAYYEQLASYRDQYLTDEANVDEYRKVTEQIYKYDKSLVDAEAKLWEDQTDALIGELEDRMSAVTNQQDKMENALSGYGDLFSVEKDKMTLESLQEQINAIDRYQEALEGLKDRGISGGLMDEVLGMDVDSATQYSKKLLSMSEKQWDEYNELWDEKQRRAAEVAEQFFKDQLDTLEMEYNNKLEDALYNLTDTSFGSGVDTAQGLIDGLASKEDALYAQARSMAAEVLRIFESVGIPSNAELSADLSLNRFQEQAGVSAADVQNVGAAVVNGMQTAADRPLIIQLTSKMEVDSHEFFSKTLESRRAVDRANPEVKDDT